jgi:hypothetical protein
MMISCELSESPLAPDPVSLTEPALTATPSTVPDDTAVEVSLPTQPAVTVESLAGAYAIVLSSLAETLFQYIGPIRADDDVQATAIRRREVCAAVWAAMRAALEASTLSREERALMLKIVWKRLQLQWNEFCGANEANVEWLESRSTEYMRKCEGTKPLAIAIHIVEELLEVISDPGRNRSLQLRVLSNLVNHRILSDICHFDALKARYRFV